jgi:hypothetical protein
MWNLSSCICVTFGDNRLLGGGSQPAYAAQYIVRDPTELVIIEQKFRRTAAILPFTCRPQLAAIKLYIIMPLGT